MNTGFGGSADTRTDRIEELQDVLVRELHSVIMTAPHTINIRRQGEEKDNEYHDVQLRSKEDIAHPLEDLDGTACMPEARARAAMLIRINSLASGHAGVRPRLIENILILLRNDVVPRIPLRGSISASGDLMPLSYIGGLFKGKPSLYAMISNKSMGQ